MKSSDCCSNEGAKTSSQKTPKELLEENTRLKEEVKTLTNRNKELENHLRSRNQESIVLQEQAKAFQEDFESERRDRERAQSRIADLEAELSIVKRELHQYNLREMQDLSQRRQAALNFHRQEYERTHPNAPVYACDGHAAGEGEDEIDCM